MLLLENESGCHNTHFLEVPDVISTGYKYFSEGLTTQKMFVHLPKIRKFYANYAKYFCVRTPKF